MRFGVIAEQNLGDAIMFARFITRPVEVARRLGDTGGGSARFSLRGDTECGRTVGGPFPMVDLTSKIGEYADTIGLIASLDLVIAVDTSTAHARGRRSWSAWQPNWRDLQRGRWAECPRNLM